MATIPGPKQTDNLVTKTALAYKFGGAGELAILVEPAAVGEQRMSLTAMSPQSPKQNSHRVSAADAELGVELALLSRAACTSSVSLWQSFKGFANFEMRGGVLVRDKSPQLLPAPPAKALRNPWRNSWRNSLHNSWRNLWRNSWLARRVAGSPGDRWTRKPWGKRCRGRASGLARAT